MKKLEQQTLFDISPQWEKEWQGMPQYEHEDQSPAKQLKVNFRNSEDKKRFGYLINQPITPLTRSVWYPPAEISRMVDKVWTAKETILPSYPVYVISKGRWESRLTVRSLEKIGVPYYIVIEPQEHKQYSSVISQEKILVLPFSDLGQGSIPARNWVWEHSIKMGAKRHWIMDDNIDGFFRFQDNMKRPMVTPNFFSILENFADRYVNLALSGFHYFMFVKRKFVIPPIQLNTRIYSCLLIQNDLTHRWRGKYNEDTDLSLRILKDGYCTALFHQFLIMKQTTMTMKGGNTDELYIGDGRLKMAESLRDQHPDVVKIVRKFNRWQHHVDYKPFKRNELKLAQGVEIQDRNDDYGFELIDSPK